MMLTIVLGIVLGIILMFVFIFLGSSENSAAVFVTIVITVALGLGIFGPLSGYNEWEMVKQTELVALSNSTASGVAYAFLNADNAYTYRYEIDSEFGTNTSHEYETETLVGNNVEEIEDPNCKIPILYVYEKSGKKSIWTFAVWAKETKYVFYVPEGTISKEVKIE